MKEFFLVTHSLAQYRLIFDIVKATKGEIGGIVFYDSCWKYCEQLRVECRSKKYQTNSWGFFLFGYHYIVTLCRFTFKKINKIGYNNYILIRIWYERIVWKYVRVYLYVVEIFTYVGFIVNSNNNNSEEIKKLIFIANI
mgnify:CR=1 FL=1